MLFGFSSNNMKSIIITEAMINARSSFVAAGGKITEKLSASLIAAFKQPGLRF